MQSDSQADFEHRFAPDRNLVDQYWLKALRETAKHKTVRVLSRFFDALILEDHQSSRPTLSMSPENLLSKKVGRRKDCMTLIGQTKRFAKCVTKKKWPKSEGYQCLTLQRNDKVGTETPTHLGEYGNAKEDWCRIPPRKEYGREVTERRQDGNLERKEFCDVAVSLDGGVDGSRHRVRANGPSKEDCTTEWTVFFGGRGYVVCTSHTENMGILSGWIASRREDVHGPESHGSRSKDPDVGRNREVSRTRLEVWCIACGESHDDLSREVCQKESVGEGDLVGGATTMIKAITAKQERTEQDAAIFIARWNLAWFEVKRTLKFVVKKKEQVYASSWKLCCRQSWDKDGSCMRCAKGTV